MIVTRKMYVLARGSIDDFQPFYEVYEQPVRDFVVGEMYHALHSTMWKIDPVHRFIDDVLDPWFSKKHDRDTDFYIPICAKMDIKLYDLQHRNAKLLGRTKPS